MTRPTKYTIQRLEGNEWGVFVRDEWSETFPTREQAREAIRKRKERDATMYALGGRGSIRWNDYE